MNVNSGMVSFKIVMVQLLIGRSCWSVHIFFFFSACLVEIILRLVN